MCHYFLLQTKIEIIKDFYGLKLKASRQTCPNCGLPMRQLRAELNSKLFYAKGVSARQMKKNVTIKQVFTSTEIEEENDGVDEVLGTEDIELVSAQPKDANIEEDEDESQKLEALTGQSYLTPVEVRKHVKLLIENEKEVIMFLLGKSDADIACGLDQSELFFFDCLAVPPSRYRPISQFKDQKFENFQTAQLSKLVQQNILLREALNDIIVAQVDGGGAPKEDEDPPNVQIDQETVEKIISTDAFI